jgi:hypothetical protein
MIKWRNSNVICTIDHQYGINQTGRHISNMVIMLKSDGPVILTGIGSDDISDYLFFSKGLKSLIWIFVTAYIEIYDRRKDR